MTRNIQTIQCLQAALRAASTRQSIIANNIANSETAGYRRQEVKFEELLSKALDSDGRIDIAQVRPELYQPKNTPVGANGNDVSMEAEVGELIENTAMYKTYMRLLAKQYRKIQMAAQ
ncbi:MAG: flagellar basal body rod protein FlgB [Phycisphaerae bacterium]